MGKAARMKAERRAAAAVAPSPAGPAVSQRTIWLVTAGLAVALAIAVGVLLATRSSGSSPPPAAAPPADEGAPASLVRSADAVGFHPTNGPGTGTIEGQPASAGHAPYSQRLLPVRSPAPGFALKTPQGETVRLADLRGKAVLLEFFTTWCPHCNAEAPHLQDIHSSLPGSQYAFLSVNADGEDAASVFAYHRYWGLAFPAVLDPSSVPGSFTSRGAPGPVTEQYGIDAYPAYYVLDRSGRITWRGDGEQPDALLVSELRQASRA